MKDVKQRKILPYFLIGVVLFYIGHVLVKRYSYAPNFDSDFLGLNKIEWIYQHVMDYPLIDLTFTTPSISVGMLCFSMSLLAYLRVKREGIYRYGEEHGSAKYATYQELKAFEDKVEEYNMIFTEKARMGLINQRLPYEKQLNKTVAVIGAPGSGKTFTFVKPNALQGFGSYIFTDTKGLLVRELGHFYEEKGYQIKIFDLITFLNSDRFNVFNYMTKETDIDRVVDTIVTVTKKSENQGEDFWIQAEALLARALIGYLYFDSQLSGYTATLPMVTDLIRHLRREHPEVKSPVEILFEDLEKALPGNYACKQWDLFNKNFDGDTRKSVLAIIASRFSVFDHDDVRVLLEDDTMAIETWNTTKTAVFINMPENNESYQFISALLLTTVFETCIKTSDAILNGTLLVDLLHLQIFADEFAQIGKIPHLSKYLAVIRNREISMKMILQSLHQLDVVYGKDEAKVILDTCDTLLYLGSNNKDTLEYVSFRAGKGTIQDSNQSETRSQHGSTSTQHSKLARDVLTVHEVATIGVDEALLIMAKQNIFRDKKAHVKYHKHASLLSSSPHDDKWYRYVRYMNAIEEFKANVETENLIELNEEEIEEMEL
ncbi:MULTISPECIES: VirD4-like conjugal transfer protein, CD1115 family [unclassified Granulicatella]|uniref:VirD4-like conjugal transfer protein, CD1115 family n=1 Tax=unclassified Granulicatella TaxID=2630493 RepID=UPI0010748F2A|nr:MULTISPECIES: type IV secretory system conjugative DNA transfer family protein [unclassified Granulicatella]MBF0780592.1 type IV secretory system conjugative DNA transfer family protein [Granulicatella sp. 19428wC4_WM01]TFU94620.1 type IV secretory system conjugative DNA transfer family protein [Granulicatella sp. WM01]